MDFYAGVGSRETPFPILTIMETLARELRKQGWTLRSGHADGADHAFEDGADGKAQIFIPWEGFNQRSEIKGMTFCPPSDAAYVMAAEFHPAWNRLTPGARSLHARNCHQVLGPDLDDPVAFLWCWTKGGKQKGGTATAIKIAESNDVPVYNLGTSEHYKLASEWLRDLGKSC